MEQPEAWSTKTQVTGEITLQRTDLWTATLKFGRKNSSETCTATVVGPRVILTAAHCIADKAKGYVTVGSAKIGLTCHHHEEYTRCEDTTPGACPAGKTTSADYALCLADSDVPVTAYETIDNGSAGLAPSRPALITGYGCTTSSNKTYGKLYQGPTKIKAMPSNKDGWDKYYVTTQDRSAVCSGDSGGATYLYSGNADVGRTLACVNSRSWNDKDEPSWLSCTYHPVFQTWAKKWKTAHSTADFQALICGMDPAAPKCHAQ